MVLAGVIIWLIGFFVVYVLLYKHKYFKGNVEQPYFFTSFFWPMYALLLLIVVLATLLVEGGKHGGQKFNTWFQSKIDKFFDEDNK